MAKYISLIDFTEEGAKQIKESTRRATAFNRAAETAGVRIIGQYWTVGSHDGVLIIETDSEDKALHCLSELAAGGKVRTETMIAYEAAEFDRIVS